MAFPRVRPITKKPRRAGSSARALIVTPTCASPLAIIAKTSKRHSRMDKMVAATVVQPTLLRRLIGVTMTATRETATTASPTLILAVGKSAML